MSEADFLKYKQNFETKIGVPTTPHKKELKINLWHSLNTHNCYKSFNKAGIRYQDNII